jgi:hypothetical protein
LAVLSLAWGAVPAGSSFQVVDDAVVGVPGIGIVRLCGAGIAVVDVDFRVGERGQARDSDVELELAGDGVPLQPGGLVACRDDDVGTVGAGMGEQACLRHRMGDQHREVGEAGELDAALTEVLTIEVDNSNAYVQTDTELRRHFFIVVTKGRPRPWQRSWSRRRPSGAACSSC